MNSQPRQILFRSSYSDYEESRSVIIFEQDGKYYAKITGHNVYNGDYDSLYEISSDEAIELALEEVEHEDFDECGT